MKKSLRAFLEGLIDYAGLFPPARLSLDEAIHNYAHYKKDIDSWMLSRFIIPASRLEDLSAYADELSASDSPFELSVTGRATQTVEDFHAEIDTLCQNCVQFSSKHDGLFRTPAAEIKLPAEVVSSQDRKQLQQLMNHAAEQINSSLQTPKIIFYENLLSENWKQEIDATIQAISEHNQKISGGTSYYQYAGYKLRCGGVKAHLFPSIEQAAFVINKARDCGVPLKGTAGLHHPVRHFASSVQTKMHGFFNVFGGALLSHANALSESELQQILREEDPQQFSFTDESFQWGEYAISTNEINHLRKTKLISYGSCSFDEPREDLRQLNLL
jgi:hypothetical protein